MAGQLPLAIAQLLIERIPPFRATSNNNATAMTPVLHTDTDASLALGNQQDPILILRQVPTRASRTVAFAFAFTFTFALALAVLLLPLDAELFERALEVLGEGDLVGGLLARLLPAHGRAAGRRDQKVALGHGRAEVEGRLEDRGLVVRVDVVEPIWWRPAQLHGDQHSVCTPEDAQCHLGCGGCRREEISIGRLACTFRVVGVVKDDDGTFE